MTNPRELLGKHVRVIFDTPNLPSGLSAAFVEGVLLGFGDTGEFEIQTEDGSVHYCWPMLTIEEVTDKPYDPFSRDDARTTALTADDVAKLEEGNATEEAVRPAADAGEGSPEGEGSADPAPAESGDASG